MLLLALYGSPRQGGNTDILLDEFLKGALSAAPKIQIQKIFIRDLKITPCQEYNTCLKTGNCAIQDEMNTLYEQLLKADAVILAAPIFFYNVPAQVKIIIDRCQALWARKYILKITNPKSQITRKGFFISTGGTKGEHLFTGTILTIKYFFKAINVDYSGELVYNKVDIKGAIREHPTALKDAFEAGKKFSA
ncbi:MAG: flavodoxin family protein [Planctomycetes bacterium]|nr:flavodoxin family protein [Planctomycetota bacterium]